MEIQPRLVWSATQARMLPAVVRSAHRALLAQPIPIRMQRPLARHVLLERTLLREPPRALHVPVVRRTWIKMLPQLAWFVL